MNFLTKCSIYPYNKVQNNYDSLVIFTSISKQIKDICRKFNYVNIRLRCRATPGMSFIDSCLV